MIIGILPHMIGLFKQLLKTDHHTIVAKTISESEIRCAVKSECAGANSSGCILKLYLDWIYLLWVACVHCLNTILYYASTNPRTTFSICFWASTVYIDFSVYMFLVCSPTAKTIYCVSVHITCVCVRAAYVYLIHITLNWHRGHVFLLYMKQIRLGRW